MPPRKKHLSSQSKDDVVINPPVVETIEVESTISFGLPSEDVQQVLPYLNFIRIPFGGMGWDQAMPTIHATYQVLINEALLLYDFHSAFTAKDFVVLVLVRKKND